MKIIQIIDQLGAGGAERVCINLANLFARNGFYVKLIVLDQKGKLFELIDDNVEVVILNKKKSKIQAYKKIVKEVQCGDILHVHMRQTHRFLQKAFLIYGKRKKVIFHDHYGKIGVNQKVPLFYTSLFKPNVYIGCSELLKSWALKNLKMNSEDVYSINNFVLRYPMQATKINAKGMVLVGNLKKVKNHAYAIQFAKHINEDLTIYCANSDGEYYKKLEEFAKDLDYADHIHFIHGCYNVQAELNKYKIGLLTSISEGDPLVIVEYLAQGLPCLVTNVGEAVKVIKHSFPFLVLDNYNLTSWEESYHKALSIDSKEIKAIFNTNYAESVYLNRYLEVYKNLA